MSVVSVEFNQRFSMDVKFECRILFDGMLLANNDDGDLSSIECVVL